ncbi:ATP-binding protein [Coleofasciculus sp. E2-BRE-01]|uniref:ATP-binding protein n=1 Tax=Coleofasciculus sp. E2-BRE-01 TaxID=3069524 RepID=UPI0032F167EB
MHSFDELWELLTTQDESVQIEVKKGSEVGKSCWQTISAFSNEPGLGGGYLILGIKASEDSDSNQYEIEGIEDIDKIQRDLTSHCYQKFNITIRPEIKPATKDNKTVLVVYIPEAQPTEKPVYIESTGLPKGAYRRISSTDQRCTDSDLQKLYRENASSSYDTTPIPEATLDDLDPQAINAYRQARAKIKPNAPELAFSDIDLLYALNVITKQQDSYCPTIAGLILFGNAIALRRYCPLHRVDYILIEGNEWITNYEDRYQTIEIREPLLLAIPRLVTNVLNDLPTRFGLAEDSDQRSDIPLIPRKVIREAIVNAVMHRDYSQRSPIQIIKYSNRLEIRNPGYSLKPLNRETLGEPGSVIRNDAIAAVLHETGFAETKGSGIRVMLEAMLEANLSLPEFDPDRNRDRFQVTLFSHNLFDDEALQWLKQFKEYNLTDEEAKMLVVLREKGTINNAICRLINDVDTLTASQSLKRLRDSGLLRSHGKSSATYYTLSSKFQSTEQSESEQLNQDSSTSNQGSLSGQSPQPSQDNLSGQSPQPNQDSSTSNQDSLSGHPSTSNQDSSTLPPEQLALELFPPVKEESVENRLAKIGKRTAPEEIKALILELCKHQNRSSSELASLVKRQRKYLLENYIKPLVDEGLLEYTIPDKPNAPDQTYRTTQK